MFPNSCGEMEQLRAILWARLALRINRPLPTEDRLLVITDVAARFSVSKDWLYRNSGPPALHRAAVREGAALQRQGHRALDRERDGRPACRAQACCATRVLG